ncbi:MAG TPA: B12-binding domain-containing radical SAM protein [Candidatus Wujingus californicus]|uniref:B12-binding domain-containing radical SAM protein n=1 Tax=Candidatus Wujingus californicus TaxID=3367618 RepID=UPI004025AED2
MFNIKPYDCLKSSQEIRQWYEINYHLLSLNGLWLKGGEPNTMDPVLFSQAKVRFLICRLSTYRDVSTSISHSLVAQIAQEVDGVFTDFAFLPPPRDMDIMISSEIPLWVGATTKEPPSSFDVLGISNSVVLELLNLPKLLHFSGIPLFKNERTSRPDIPLIILGGANAAVTSVLHGPLKQQGLGDNYGLVDAVIVGEGEYSIKQFLEIVKKGKSGGLTKAEILNACHGKVDGFYEPDKYEHRYKTVVHNLPEKQEITEHTPPASPPSQGGEGEVKNSLLDEEVLAEIIPRETYVSCPVKGAIVFDLDNVRTLESGPIWYETDSVGTGCLQISNGCPCFCSFCAESWERKPYRERSLSNLLKALEIAKAQQGLDTVNLLSFNFNTHAELYPIILSFFKKIANLSLKSQRFDLLSTDRFLAEVQQIIGKTTISCGMEGISERLRRYLHKNLTEAQIYKACEFLFERGIRELKIFLISTGLEQQEDFSEFRRFVKRLADLKSMSDSKVRIIFSLTPLYYPPHTPLQFHACLTAIEEKGNTRKEIERICKLNNMEFRESASHGETWLMQLLAMGDRRLTQALIYSSIKDGFTYYNTVSEHIIKNWRGYLEKLGLSEEMYFREKDKDCVFPWDDIDLGISKRFLWEEYKRSIIFTEREYCLGRPHLEAQCLGCGACPSTTHINNITKHKISEPFLLEEITQIAENKRQTCTLKVVVEIDPSIRMVPKRYIGVIVARALMLTIPEIIPHYHSVSGHLRDFITTSDFTSGINIYNLAFVLNTNLKSSLNEETLSQKIKTIQKHCKEFKIKKFIWDTGSPLDVKYIAYNIYFNKDFKKSFIEQKLGEYLHTNYVKHTLLRNNGQIMFKVDTKTRKNALVIHAEINSKKQIKEPECSILMVVANRFDINTFIETFYGKDRRQEIVRTQIESLGYYGRKPTTQKATRCTSCGNNINEILIAGKSLIEDQCLICSISNSKFSA